MRNKKIIHYLIGCAIQLLMLSSLQAATLRDSTDMKESGAGKIFRAGAATSNITPFLGGRIIGNWIAPSATHVHDELHARCLVLDDGETRLAFIIIDNLGIKREIIDEAKLKELLSS